MHPEVTATLEAGVLLLALSDPARKNAMSPELGDALAARVAEYKDHPDLRAVILTGVNGAFSAGGDLAMLDRLRKEAPEETYRFMKGFYARYLSILDFPVPVIAAIEGPAVGAGLCVALACDLIVVDHGAKLALNFVRLGLHPGMGATYLLPRKVGSQRAAELLYTGRFFDGAEAVALGLAVEAVAAEEVLPRAKKLATAIAAGGPLAQRDLKRALGVDRAALTLALEHEARAQSTSYQSEDLGEGLAAAAARRAPIFLGVRPSSPGEVGS